MKPASFRYFAPTTVDEVVSLLCEYGDEAKVLAGGQSLVPLMNFRFATPTVLVDVNRVSGLDRIGVSDTVVLGATARQLAVEDSAEVAAAAPVLGQALRHVGHVAIRSRGTIGGSIAHADPAAELPAVLVALDGEVRVRSSAGERCVAARDLYKGLFETSLGPEELITGVLFPVLGGGSAVYEVARRQGDFALAGAVALVATDGLDTITEARIVLFSVGPTPVRAGSSEEFLRGRKASDRAVLSEATRLAAERLEPVGDVQVPASYKKSVAATVTRRALADAVARNGR